MSESTARSNSLLEKPEGDAIDRGVARGLADVYHRRCPTDSVYPGPKGAGSQIIRDVTRARIPITPRFTQMISGS